MQTLCHKQPGFSDLRPTGKGGRIAQRRKERTGVLPEPGKGCQNAVGYFLQTPALEEESRREGWV